MCNHTCCWFGHHSAAALIAPICGAVAYSVRHEWPFRDARIVLGALFMGAVRAC